MSRFGNKDMSFSALLSWALPSHQVATGNRQEPSPAYLADAGTAKSVRFKPIGAELLGIGPLAVIGTLQFEW